MIAEHATELIKDAVECEHSNIVGKYGMVYASTHEGYAVLLEEVQEACEASKNMQSNLEAVWDDIRNNFSEGMESDLRQVKEWALNLAEEAIQCAAVCERFDDTLNSMTVEKNIHVIAKNWREIGN